MFKKVMKELDDLKKRWKRSATQSMRMGEFAGRMKHAKDLEKKHLHDAYRKAALEDEPRAKFIVNPHASDDNLSNEGTYRSSYASLKRRFGNPTLGDQYKTSSAWIFEEPKTGSVFTIYDYKQTNLYDEEGLPSVEAFRRKKSVEWNVGAKDKKSANRFIAWLRKQR